MTRKANSDELAALRQQAETVLRRQPEEVREMPPEDIQHLVHELQVHQIELEMQNEELRRTQQELGLTCDRYLDLYDFAPVGYLTLSETGLILQANLTAATMLGVERGKMIKNRFSRFILPGDQDTYYLHRKKVLKTESQQSCELRLVKKDGTPFHAHLECTVAKARTSNQLRVTITDITERKRAEEALKEYRDQLAELVEERTGELREAQEQLVRREKLAMLGQLAGSVGHELRNPLGAIKNAAYFLNMVLKDPNPETREMLEVLDKEVNTAEKIISSLLDFARTRPPTRRKVDLNDIVRATLSRTPLPDAPRVEVVLQLDADLPPILADPDQLFQVLDNLVLNGIQAIPSLSPPPHEATLPSPPQAGGKQGGRLVIRTAMESPEWMTVSVADTGEGIPKENLEKIFEPLFTTKARGIGLGLAVVKTLVEGHGGTIRVESRVEEGSTFTVRLPLGASAAVEGEGT